MFSVPKTVKQHSWCTEMYQCVYLRALFVSKIKKNWRSFLSKKKYNTNNNIERLTLWALHRKNWLTKNFPMFCLSPKLYWRLNATGPTSSELFEADIWNIWHCKENNCMLYILVELLRIKDLREKRTCEWLHLQIYFNML